MHAENECKNISAEMYTFVEESTVLSVASLLPSTPGHILPFSFPKYASLSAGSSEESIGNAEVKQVSIANLQRNVPFLDLRVCTVYS